MANVNISTWGTGQVAEWLRGLGGAVDGYISMLEARGLDGARLLAMRCDDLEAFGVQIIGHQELLLEAVEHLRNFHYELHRENVQQLSLRLSVAARSLYNELRTRHDGVKLETDTLSGVARLIAAVKPLVYWLNRAPFRSSGGLADRKRALLDLSLRAATSAQRERFAEYPARVVTAAAEAMANLADYIVQEISDPVILQPAALSTVVIRQGDRPLDFSLAPGCGGRHYLADIRFGSPAHASGLIEHGDEIVAVGDQLVVGWGGEAILRTCVARAAAYGGELALTLRRRPGARAAAASPLHAYRPFRRHAPAHAPVPHYYHDMWPWIHADLALFRKQICATSGENTESGAPEESVTAAVTDAAADSSDPEEADPLWPPDDLNTRMYPPKPRSLVQRRHTISGASPISKSPNMISDQFWQELRSHKNFKHTGSTHMNIGEEADDGMSALYRRDKAVSYSTGLELSPRPKTCLGVGAVPVDPAPPPPPRPRDAKQRGKLDKAHSTPAYDLGADGADGGSLVTQIIPESPTTPTESPTIFVHSAEKADQILDFKKSSSQIGEAILHQRQKRMVTTDVHKSKFTFSEMDEAGDGAKHMEVDTDAEGESETTDLLETVNIGLLEKRTNIDKVNRKEQASPATTTPCSGNGLTDGETHFDHENSNANQSDIAEAVNEQRTVANVRTSKLRKPLASQTESPTTPPEPPPRPIATRVPHGPSPPVKEYPPLKPVSQLESFDVNELTPLKPPRLGDHLQISVPLKHITKHDIHVIPNTEASPRRELLIPLNHEATGLLEVPRLGAARSHPHLGGPELSGARVPPAVSPAASVSPTASVVRGIFPSSKSKSLKKKNSILAKRRKVSVRELGGGTWQGLVLQRVRVRQRTHGPATTANLANPTAPASPPLVDSPAGVWVRRWYVLRDNTLYGFRALDCEKADCLIFLKGFTASPAPEVKSKPFAFKVYHTGTVFYFAVETLETMTAWLDHISRATMLCYDSWERAHKDKKVDESKHFSETDYSEGDLSDRETTEKKSEGKEKDKSKFGSLKKLTHRIHKSESQESVSSAAASLDRKYLRFFSRSKSKQNKTSTPVPTEHYRSYRRVTAAGGELTRDVVVARVQTPAPAPALATADTPRAIAEPAGARLQKKLPKPINYIHASNPNLLDFEKSDFVAKSNLNVPLSKPKVHKPENFMGFVTLQEFMLKKQEEERREMYSNRVLMGIERDARTSSKRAAKELQRQWERIVPDVIYGELRTSADDDRPAPEYLRGRTLPEAPRSAPVPVPTPAPVRSSDGTKPVSVKDKDGYEKIVYVTDADATTVQPDDDPPQVLPRKSSRTEEDAVEGGQRRRSETGDTGVNVDSGEGRDELRRGAAPQPPPKIMPKSRHVLNRQSSLGSGMGGGGADRPAAAATAHGDNPERFWRSSLRRNDRVHSRPAEARAEPKPLKSAAQYTPLSLPAPTAALATAPHLHITLDTGEVVSTASPGVSRLRQVFQGGANSEAQPVWTGRGVQYPHLQCPPTFEPETYSLADCATSHQRHKHHA